ncbi:DUF6239 family natural product biosynthesis protein [Saccharothrix obliqua]|uniref:DUF6239 family natural product biosynthesis protein n=1 Tax=Saccharothrix obliqua TaxID=2861747 RepID=UPI001C602101|nr:DUF6239 family natural product biosynthesis protein [Saccharothrix obliqua]MBW4722032.1 hypothetical protein [Saccharothrix obliqua]
MVVDALAPHAHPSAAGDGIAGLRLLVVVSLVVLTGTALLRPVAGAGRVVRWAAVVAGVVVVAGEWALTALAPRPQHVLASVVPLALAVAAVVVPWRRFAPVVAVGVTALALAEFAVAWSEAEFRDAALRTGVAALAWFGVARPRRSLHATAAVLAVAVLAGAAHLTAVDPRRPVPGVLQSREVALGGEAVRVLVAPQRPGWNLVRVTRGGIAAGAAPERLTATAPRPGTGGWWALVDLPPGRGSLWLRRGGELVALPVDTGSRRGPDVSGPDGPECADAVLGAWLAERVAGGCPADQLTGGDAEALRATVGFLAARGRRSVTLVADHSPRASAAAAVVHDALRRNGMTDSGGPVLVVAGWAAADRALRDVAAGRLPGGGSYLAPWLLTAPLLAIPAAQVIPLRQSPREPAALAYVAALNDRVPGAVATPAGYAAWRGEPDTGPLRLYAASLVTMGLGTSRHAHGGVTWFPGGGITPVSDGLTGDGVGRRWGTSRAAARSPLRKAPRRP